MAFKIEYKEMYAIFFS